MRRLAIAILAAFVLAACDKAADCEPVPDCDWATELWDGHQCLLRTDHEGHMG